MELSPKTGLTLGRYKRLEWCKARGVDAVAPLGRRPDALIPGGRQVLLDHARRFAHKFAIIGCQLRRDSASHCARMVCMARA